MKLCCFTSVAIGLIALLSLPLRLPAAEPSGAELEFFENQVRPLLAGRCYKCHGPNKQKGGLRVDSRAAPLRGGDSGPAVVPGKPEQGFLVDAVNYGDVYQMPPDGKLPAKEIAALTRWVRGGAIWPNDGAGQRAETSKSDFDLKQRARHWSFQPIQEAQPPAVHDANWPACDIDRFILARLEAKRLSPAKPADRRSLIRRLYFDVVGLPPTPEAVEAFVADASPDAYQKIVDSLLKSPRFGERRARHWLDLVRYAESRGHEFDYDTPNAWQYRDYVIRAFNADVPYDQFVREHLAGDLIDPPRTHPTRGFDESILGTGFWFLGEWVHSPVEVRQDEADRFDNMIDVMTKTFLGLTVACARCHDHKFDAITQNDYYALAGYLQSSAYRQARFESIEQNRQVAEKLDELNRDSWPKLGGAFVEARRPVLERFDAYLLAAREVVLSGPALRKRSEDIVFEDFESGDYDGWTVQGTAFGEAPQTQETIAKYQGHVNAHGRFFVNSHNIRTAANAGKGDAHRGTMTSRAFRIDRDFISLLVGGGSHQGATCVNLLVDGKAARTATGRNDNRMFPVRWDVRDLRGHEARIQVVDNHTGGWGNIGIDHIVFTDEGEEALVRPERFTADFRRRIATLAQRRRLSAAPLERLVASLINASKDPDDVLHAWASVAQRCAWTPRRWSRLPP